MRRQPHINVQAAEGVQTFAKSTAVAYISDNECMSIEGHRTYRADAAARAGDHDRLANEPFCVEYRHGMCLGNDGRTEFRTNASPSLYQSIRYMMH
jgi:hypothetical protein